MFYLQTLMSNWLYQIAVVLLVTVVLDVVSRIIIRRLIRRTEKTQNIWDDAVLESLRAPVVLLLWCMGVAVCVGILAAQLEMTIVVNTITPVKFFIFIVFLCWFALRLVSNVEANYIADRTARNLEIDHTKIDVTGKVSRIFIVVLGVLTSMQTFGVSITALVAVGGVGGIAVSFAAKELIANFFGGLMIYIQKPFTVGDTITSPDKDIEGTVEQISWGQTVIRRFDSRPLYVPNALFTTIIVRNNTQQTNRRISEYVGVRYDDAAQVQQIVNDIREMLYKHPGIDQDNLIMVNFDRFAASSLDIFFYCFTRTVVWSEYHAVKENVLLRIINIIMDHGAQVAFPTSTLHVPEAVKTLQLDEIEEQESVRAKIDPYKPPKGPGGEELQQGVDVEG